MIVILGGRREQWLARQQLSFRVTFSFKFGRPPVGGLSNWHGHF
jgi:hypothetical protein